MVQKAGEDVSVVEEELGMVEQAIEEIKSEQLLIGKMIEWKPSVSQVLDSSSLLTFRWEQLEQEAPKEQWRYFDPGEE